MERYKNYALWTAVASLIGMIIQDTEVIRITPEKYDIYVNSALGIAVLLGIVNNPSIGKGIKDKKKAK